MERKEQFIIEVFLGILLIIFLIIMILLFIGISESDKESDRESTTSTVIISNSFNTNSYNQYTTPISYSYPKHITTTKDQYKDCDDYDKDYLRYTHRGYHDSKRGVFGNDINQYIVYVKNREKVGGYFKVIFSFKDPYGKTTSESVSYYIKPGEEKKFVYQTIYDKHENCDWDYKVILKTESPGTKYSYRSEKRCY